MCFLHKEEDPASPWCTEIYKVAAILLLTLNNSYCLSFPVQTTFHAAVHNNARLTVTGLNGLESKN